MTVRGHTFTVRAFGATHTGRVRPGNEDSYLMGDAVFAVADGMGGHQAGEIASDAALEPLRALDVPSMTDPAEVGDALAAAVEQANTLVVERAQADPALEGMGTTLTAVAIREGQLHVAHVGDSRAYLLRDAERMSQLTTDHTLVERLIQEGRLSRDEAATHPQRNVITRAIGHEATVEVEVLPPITLQEGDQILLCSDGLSGPVDDERIAAILNDNGDGDAAVNALLAQANAAGGPDNITAVLLRVGDRWRAAEPAAAAEGSSTQQIAVTPPAGTPTTDVGTGDGADDGPAAVSIDSGGAVDTDEPWAEKMAHVADDRHGDEGTGHEGTTRSRGRMAAAVLGVVVMLAVLVGGGWLLLSRSYFVGEHEGMVAVYQGLPQEVGGMPIARVLPEEITTTPVAEFPAFRQQAINDGLTAQSLADARRIVADLQNQLRESQSQSRGVGEPQTSATADPSSEPPAGP
ncbi:MAG TPA: Stp1/IreP family PP2C-type Ser/Thr phosphatase [Euzebyales bacterium]|nr:Stp1/IreP family PP2C-type Ser/Thr phosphatase [Euzebyales bacterium]